MWINKFCAGFPINRKSFVASGHSSSGQRSVWKLLVHTDSLSKYLSALTYGYSALLAPLHQ